jgi:hypothetical protein
MSINSIVTLIVGVLFLITGIVGVVQKDPLAYIQIMFGATWLKLAALEA